MPPYSSAMVRPNSPISFMPSTMSSGNSSLCSSSVAYGRISLLTNSRAVAAISLCTAVNPGVCAGPAMSQAAPYWQWIGWASISGPALARGK
jgi:hypothetical protein